MQIGLLGTIVPVAAVGLALMKRGAFVGAKVCFAISAVLLEYSAVDGIARSGAVTSASIRLSLQIIAVTIVLVSLIAVSAWSDRQRPSLSAKIVCPAAFHEGDAYFLVIELQITNDGGPSIAQDFCASLVPEDGSEPLSAPSFRVDHSFVLSSLPEEYAQPREYHLDSWLERTVSTKPIGRGSTSLPGFFVARFKARYPDRVLPVHGRRLEVTFHDFTGRPCKPAVYSRADKDGTLLIGFGTRRPLGEESGSASV